MGWSPGLTEGPLTPGRLPSHQIEEDAYQEDLGFSLGHLGKSGSGRVRQTQVNEATKARISKTLQVRASPGDGGGAWATGAGHSPERPALPAADPAEAERGVRWEVHHPRPLVGDRLQRGLHPTPGAGSRAAAGPGRPCSPALGCCFLTCAPLQDCHGFGRGAPKKPPRLYLDSQHMSRFAGTTESLWPRAGPAAPTPEDAR